MSFVSLEVEVDADYIRESLLSPSNSDVDLIEFIKSIDADVADEGFTLELIGTLVNTMITEYEASTEHYASRSLEAGFNPASSGVNSIRHYNESWDSAMKNLNIFKQIKSLLSDLEEG